MHFLIRFALFSVHKIIYVNVCSYAMSSLNRSDSPFVLQFSFRPYLGEGGRRGKEL